MEPTAPRLTLTNLPHRAGVIIRGHAPATVAFRPPLECTPQSMRPSRSSPNGSQPRCRFDPTELQQTKNYRLDASDIRPAGLHTIVRSDGKSAGPAWAQRHARRSWKLASHGSRCPSGLQLSLSQPMPVRHQNPAGPSRPIHSHHQNYQIIAKLQKHRWRLHASNDFFSHFRRSRKSKHNIVMQRQITKNIQQYLALKRGESLVSRIASL